MKFIKKAILTMFLSGFIALPLVHAEEVVKQEVKEKGFHKFFAQLNLTEDQKKQLSENKKQKRENMKVLFGQMKSQKAALKQELMKPSLDMAKINEIQSQMKANMAQMADNRLNSILEVRKVLTPEQFSKFLSLMEERRSHWKNKKGEMDPFKQESK